MKQNNRKFKVLILFFIFTMFNIIYGCTDKEIIDLRDNLIGDYSGIKISTTCDGTKLNSNTTDIKLKVSKTMIKSNIKLKFSPGDASYIFEINGENLISKDDYHPPTLRKSNDSLFFRHQSGLGPAWVNCIVKKQ